MASFATHKPNKPEAMLRNSSFITVAFASTLVVSSVHSQDTQLSWDEVVDCNAAGEGTLRPRITLNASNSPVVLWGKSAPGSNYVAIGEAGGFSPIVEVSAPGCVPSVADWMGSSIASVGNTVWVVMKATPEETKPTYVRRSDDGGYTWGDTIRVDPFDGLVSRFPTIDVADPGRPLVQYMQFDGGWSGARQVVTHFMAGSFMEPVQVSTPYAPGEVCDCCPGQVITNGDRTVALYRNAGSNIRVMWGATSDDHGASFPLGSVIDTTGWSLGSCPSSGPDGYLVGDSIRYVWMSGANNGTKVYLGSALASDLSLGTARFVNPGQASGQTQNFPRIAGNGDTLGVVWEQYTNGARDIFFSWSVTGVAGLSVPEMVNTDMTGSQKTPDIAYADGSFHIVWSEFGANQVRYRKGTVLDANGVAEQLAGVAVTHWPNPVNDLLHVEGGSWIRAEIIDAQGRMVDKVSLQDGVLNMSNLAPGGYTIHLVGIDGAKAVVRVHKR